MISSKIYKLVKYFKIKSTLTVCNSANTRKISWCASDPISRHWKSEKIWKIFNECWQTRLNFKITTRSAPATMITQRQATRRRICYSSETHPFSPAAISRPAGRKPLHFRGSQKRGFKSKRRKQMPRLTELIYVTTTIPQFLAAAIHILWSFS